MNYSSAKIINFGRSFNRTLWLNESCPAETAAYNCYFQGMTERARMLDAWRPSIYLNVTDIYSRIENKTILFYGDSVTLQQYISFSCLLNSDNPGYWELKWAYRDWLGEKNCPYAGNHCEPLSGSCVKFSSGLRICYEWNHEYLKKGKLQDAIQTYKLGPKDIILANFGLWQHRKAKLADEMDFFKTDLKEVIGKVIILWTESSPQHFPGDASGYHAESNKALYGSLQEKFIENSAIANIPCLPYTDHRAAYEADFRNRLAYEKFSGTINIVRIWEQLANLSYAHVVLPRRSGDLKFLDCTHWCIPGPIVYIFALALKDALAIY